MAYRALPAGSLEGKPVQVARHPAYQSLRERNDLQQTELESVKPLRPNTSATAVTATQGAEANDGNLARRVEELETQVRHLLNEVCYFRFIFPLFSFPCKLKAFECDTILGPIYSYSIHVHVQVLTVHVQPYNIPLFAQQLHYS